MVIYGGSGQRNSSTAENRNVKNYNGDLSVPLLVRILFKVITRNVYKEFVENLSAKWDRNGRI